CEKLNYKRLKSFNKRNKEKLELAAALNAQRRAESGELTEEGTSFTGSRHGSSIGGIHGFSSSISGIENLTQ
ncbi:hypothetical protein ANCDUO_26609, partial [Ancylostoma duodenale]